jgi:hypothetical protein
MLYRIHRIFLDFFHCRVFQKNTTFRKPDLFPSSGEGGGEDTYSVGPLRERLSRCLLPHLHLRTETDPVSETSCFFGIQDDGKSPEYFCEFCTTYTIVRILSSLSGNKFNAHSHHTTLHNITYTPRTCRIS